MNSLFDVIEDFENEAKIPAMRAIVHSSMTRAIYAIKQQLLAEQRRKRNNDRISIDQRNEIDIEREIEEEEGKRIRDMGYEDRIPPLKLASLYCTIYNTARTNLYSLITSEWDKPLSLEQMLDYILKRNQNTDDTFIEELSKITKTDVEVIKQIYKEQIEQEQKQFAEMVPEIIFTFNGFNDEDTSAIEQLPKTAHYQLGLKVLGALKKTRDQILTRIIKTRNLDNLGAIPILDDAIKKTKDWLVKFEKQNELEF